MDAAVPAWSSGISILGLTVFRVEEGSSFRCTVAAPTTGNVQTHIRRELVDHLDVRIMLFGSQPLMSSER
jgi:hypothetical protein